MMMMMDEHLYTQSHGNRTTSVLWRPGNKRSVVPGPNSYRKFTHIVRTVHINEAIDICARDGMQPRYIQSLSILNSRKNLLYGHKIQVLWFGVKNEEHENTHDWYGNVEFSLPINTVLERWKNYYLVEFMTARTHTSSRILITNRDYSGLLPQYDPRERGGPWLLTKHGNFELMDCLRFNNESNNIHGHTLELMIEVTYDGSRNILKECTISFRNHERAIDLNRPHVCHRFQFRGKNDNCPTPFTPAMASRVFFTQHTRLSSQTRIAKPTLSPSAQKFLQCFLTMQSPSRSLVATPSHPGFGSGSWQSHSNYAFHLLRLQCHFPSGFMFERKHIVGSNQGGFQYMATNQRVMRKNYKFEEHEDVKWDDQRVYGLLQFGNGNQHRYELHFNKPFTNTQNYFLRNDVAHLPIMTPPLQRFHNQPTIPFPIQLHDPQPKIHSSPHKYPSPPPHLTPMLLPGFFQHSWAV